MVRNIMNKKRKKKGFTLIELIIVIAIIAILAAIALPKFMEVREKSNMKTDIANAKNIHTEVCALIADGEIATPAAPNVSQFQASSSTALVDGMQSMEKLKTAAYKNNDFYVQVDDGGNVKVFADSGCTVEVYPVTNAAFTK